jgi:hypothetical protein
VQLGAGTVFLICLGSVPIAGPIQASVALVLMPVSHVVKGLGHEPHQSAPSEAVVEMHGAVPQLPPHIFMTWCLSKHRDNFTLLYLVFWAKGKPLIQKCRFH